MTSAAIFKTNRQNIKITSPQVIFILQNKLMNSKILFSKRISIDKRKQI